jgi:tetratricopeptide (TPR) repeat protein
MEDRNSGLKEDFGTDSEHSWARVASELRVYRDAQRSTWGEIDNSTIARFVTGEASAEEIEQVRDAMRTHPKVQECVDVLREVLGVSEPAVAGDELPVIKLWTRLYRRLASGRALAALAVAASMLLAFGFLLRPSLQRGKGTVILTTPSSNRKLLAEKAELQGADPTNVRASRGSSAGVHSNSEISSIDETDEQLRRAAEALPGGTAPHVKVGNALLAKGQVAEAIAEYGRAISLKPDHPALHVLLGNALLAERQLGEAIAEYRRAISLEPGSAIAHVKLGDVLLAQGDLAGAQARYEKAIDLKPDHAATWVKLGDVFRARGKLDEAETRYQKAIHHAALAIDTKLAEANPVVIAYQRGRSHGVVLMETGKRAEALKSYEAALANAQELARTNPSVTEFQHGLAETYNNIGSLYRRTGKPSDALRSFAAALKIDTKLADANPSVSAFQRDRAISHNNIGVLLMETGKPVEALKSYEAALAISAKLAKANPSDSELQNDLAASHNNIGNVLTVTGESTEAMTSYEAALAIQTKLVREHPESPDFASELGGTLDNLAGIDMNAKRLVVARDRLRQAVEAQRRALASNPANPTYRQFMVIHLTNLIKATRALGDTAGLADAERQLVELLRTAPIDARLKAIVKGEQRPKDVGERLQFAQRAYEIARHSAAARLWQEALDADPKLGDDRRALYRYNAACAAALAGCGQGKDDPPPSGDQKTKLRQQALDWLTAELGAWAKLLTTATTEQRGGIAKTLEHWQTDTDLAGIRDVVELAKLRETERVAFRKLWADVDALLKKASRP